MSGPSRLRALTYGVSGFFAPASMLNSAPTLAKGVAALIRSTTSLMKMKGVGALRKLSFFNRSNHEAEILFHNLFQEHEIGVPSIVSNSKLHEFNKKWNYVVTQDNKLIVGARRNIVGGGHIDLAGGIPVKAAGEVRIVNGRIKHIDNSSGHYMPSGRNAQIAAENAFRELGFDVGGTYIEKFWDVNSKLPKCGKWRPIYER